MTKKIVLRGLLGLSLGITIGYIITILFSLIYADGYYSPCVPDLVSMMGNEINAVILQTFLCGALGAGFSVSSVIWEIEHWSIVKQTGIYFMIIAIIMMPIAYCLFWMEHSFLGFLSYLVIFTFIFVVVWVIQFLIGRHAVNQMNKGLQETRER